MVALGMLVHGEARARRTGQQPCLETNEATRSLEAPPFAPPPPVNPLPEPPASPKEALTQPRGAEAPLDDDTRYLPSRGSKNHHKGQCRPCRSNDTPEGCSDGVNCNFCHCRHGGDKFVEMAISRAKSQARRAMPEDERPPRKELQHMPALVFREEPQANPKQQGMADLQIPPLEPSPPPLMQRPEGVWCTTPVLEKVHQAPKSFNVEGVSLAVEPVSGSHSQCQPCGFLLGDGTQALQMQFAPALVTATHSDATSPCVATQQIAAQQMQLMQQAYGAQMLQTRVQPYIMDVDAQMQKGSLPQIIDAGMQLPQWAPMSQDVPKYERREDHQKMNKKNNMVRHAPTAGYQWPQNVPHCGKAEMGQHTQKFQQYPMWRIDDLMLEFWPVCASQSAEELIQTLRQATPAYYDE